MCRKCIDIGATTPAPPATTHWTGKAGNGQWSDPGNWDNGVPPAGGAFMSGGQDVAVIDNSIDAAPFTVTISGDLRAGDIAIDAADPAGGSAVSLTGSLDLATNQTSGGANFGTLARGSGTFELDGGTLSVANVTQSGGTLGCGTAALDGSSTLDSDIINGSFTIGNPSEVVVAANSFLVADGGPQNVVTASSGSDLSVQGALYLAGTLDIHCSATVTLDNGVFQSGLDGTPAVIQIEAGGTLVDAVNGVFQGVTLEGSFDVGAGPVVITRSATTVF